ncbi:PAS domain S-box protein [Robiginitalea sp. M366]|uniref:PAS domain-containing protein n=1 Tax=Robiginitalea aestuariiviva TaxID=3036903 RepID=UPI00240DD57C|nr:PAS domain-containing protein [Robiginitalea aestuariiviva]MDG1572046.1 PAS domain S-box protein [Robiginitalea aestuariiviva]
MSRLATYSLSAGAKNLAAQGLALLDPQGRILQLNTPAESLFGFLSSEIHGKDLWSLVEEVPGQAGSPGQEALHILHSKDRGDLPVLMRFSPLLEELDYQLVFLRDLEADTRAEIRLKAQQTQLNALIEAIPDSIFIQDFQGNFLEYYPPISGPLFEPGTEIRGHNMEAFFPQKLTNRFLEAFDAIRKDRNPRHLEFSLGPQAKAHYEARLVPMNNHKILSIVREVTQAKTVQNVLNLRNRALEAAGNGFVISDARLPDQPVIYINSAFTEITGYQPEEVLGRNCRFLQGNDRKQPGIRRIKQCLEAREPCSEILRNYRKDGSLFWNELTLTPIVGPEGEPHHFIGVVRDVSLQVTEARRKDRIHKILEEITGDAPLQRISSSLCDLLRLPLAAATVHMHLLHPGRHCLETLATRGPHRARAIPPPCISLKKDGFGDIADAVRANREIIRVIPAAQSPSFPTSKTPPQRGEASVWAFPIRSSHQEVLGSCTFLIPGRVKPDTPQREAIREVLQLARVAIERHQTRQRLQQSHQQLESYARKLEQRVAIRTHELEETVERLQESNRNLEQQITTTQEAERRALASHVLFTAMARNFPKGIILVADPSMQLVHLEGEELESLDLEEWNHYGANVSDLPGFSAHQLKTLNSKVRATLEGKHLSFELERAGNTYAVHTTPLTVDGQIQWALLVWSNTTRQKRTQQELLRALRTEQELNDLKSRFISMASHEFRTPLSAILSSAILIEKQNHASQEGKRQRYTKQIKNNVRNLVVILDDFLSLSRLEEGEIRCKASDFDLLSLLGSVLEELETSLKVGQYFVERYSLPDAEVRLDPKLTRHILINLLSNAIKYSPENSPIYIALQPASSQIQLSVTDRGMGIPRSEQDQLFHRFFRARNAINIPGTGLGLHIVKQYTDLMGGTIDFESAEGRGSTFRITLPKTYKPGNHETDSDY